MSNIEVVSKTPDSRPAFVLSDVQGADFFRIKAAGKPLFALNDVTDFAVGSQPSVAYTDLNRVGRKTL